MIEKTISKIKTLLHYCGNEEVEIYDERILRYLKTKMPELGREKPFATITLGLYLECVSIVPTMYLQYVYEGPGHWEDWDEEFILFNDPSSEYEFGQDYGHREKDEIKYSDIDENIWGIIENIVFEKAEKHVKKCLEDAKESCKFYEDLLKEFITKTTSL